MTAALPPKRSGIVDIWGMRARILQPKALTRSAMPQQVAENHSQTKNHAPYS